MNTKRSIAIWKRDFSRQQNVQYHVSLGSNGTLLVLYLLGSALGGLSTQINTNDGESITPILPTGRVDHSAEIPTIVSELLMNKELSDVTISVEGMSFPGHSVILAAQSHYFKQQLFGDERADLITLYNIDAVVFQDVLRYLYTGQLKMRSEPRDYNVLLMRLAEKLQLKSLRSAVVDDVSAHLLTKENSTESVIDFFDQNAQVILQSDIFPLIPQSRLAELLARDTFYVEREMDVFTAVMRWGEGRTKEECKAILRTVRLPLIPLHDLMNEVYPAKAYTDEEILDAVKAAVAGKPSAEPRTPKVFTLPMRNVALTEYGAQVTAGSDSEFLLRDHTSHSNNSGFTWHRIKPWTDEKGIVIRLDRVYNINTVELHLQDNDDRLVSYYMELSITQGGPWSRVIDYTDYKCRGKQLLYFEATPAQFVRVIGTSCTADNVFAVVSLQCYFTNHPLVMNNGLIEPEENQALHEKGALILTGKNRGKSMLDGTQSDRNSYTYCDRGQSIKVVLAQPIYVGSLRFRLHDQNRYRYSVEVSVDGQTWNLLVDRSLQDNASWQTLQFAKMPISFIKFNAISGRNLVIAYLECPDQSV